MQAELPEPRPQIHLDTDLDRRRRSIGVHRRPPISSATAGRFKSAQLEQVRNTEANSALQQLANKGSKIQELEAELAIAQAENVAVNAQLEEASSTAQTQTNKLAIVQAERDFLSSQRKQERLDAEQQLAKSEQTILNLTQSLRRAEQAKVLTTFLPLLSALQTCLDLTCGVTESFFYDRSQQKQVLRWQRMTWPAKPKRLQTLHCITLSNFNSFSMS